MQITNIRIPGFKQQPSNKIPRILGIITSKKEMEHLSTIGFANPTVLSLGFGDITQTPHPSTIE